MTIVSGMHDCRYPLLSLWNISAEFAPLAPGRDANTAYATLQQLQHLWSRPLDHSRH